MKKCPKCGNANSDGSNNCTKCGTPLGGFSSGSRNSNRQHVVTHHNYPQSNRNSFSQPQYQNQGYQRGHANYSSPVRLQQMVQNPYQNSRRNGNNKTKLILFAVTACVIFLFGIGLLITLSQSSSRSTSPSIQYGGGNVGGGSTVTTNDPNEIISCPWCSGSGYILGGDRCDCCGGIGKATRGQIAGSITTPVKKDDSKPQPTNKGLCSACGGSTHCPICHGYDGVQYGDINYCSSCGNSRKCKWCKGTGFQQ